MKRFHLRFFSILAIATSLIYSFSPLGFTEEVTYIDGQAVTIPKLELYDSRNPGPHKDQIKEHAPRLKVKRRKEGLEDTWRIHLSLNHPVVEDEAKMLYAVYILDKDDIIIGYHRFEKKENLNAEFRVNGIINYIKIYVYCLEHGLWRNAYKLSAF